METWSDVIDALGGTNALARRFGVTPPAVSKYRKQGIPAGNKRWLVMDALGENCPDWVERGGPERARLSWEGK